MREKTANILMAEIGSPQGLKGEVKLICHAAHPDTLIDLAPLMDERGRVFTIEYMHPHKAHYIAAFAEIPDRTAAEKARGTKLFIPRDRFPPLEAGEYYHHDLLGMNVMTTDGQALGAVVALQNFGAGDLFEVHDDATGRTYFLPFDENADINVDTKLITLDPPAGLLDDPDQRSQEDMAESPNEKKDGSNDL